VVAVLPIIDGAWIRIPEPGAIRLSKDPRLSWVEANAVMRKPYVASASQTTQHNNNYLWHLDRLDDLHMSDPPENTYTWCSDGTGAKVWVLDSSLDLDHPEFAGRVIEAQARNFNTAWQNQYYPRNSCINYQETGSHGTSVAAAAVGTNVGVAKGAQVVPVTVVDCIGNSTLAYVTQGLNYIDAEIDAGRGGTAGDVVNFSGGFRGFSATLDGAIDNLNSGGAVIVTSADNHVRDACDYSPNHKGADGTILVAGGTSLGGSQTIHDYRWQIWANGMVIDSGGGSSSGSCVNIWAPANSVYVALIADADPNTPPATDLYGYSAGTSYSSPLVAGVAARYMQKYKNTYGVKPSAHTVKQFIRSNSAGHRPAETSIPAHWVCPHPTRPGLIRGQWDSAPCSSSWPAGSLDGTSTTPRHIPYIPESTAGLLFWDEGSCSTQLW
jgi:hypothetical protein